MLEKQREVIVERLSCDTLDERHDTTIFIENQSRQDFAKAKRQPQQACLWLLNH